jgi:LPXTG-motif cell wall-anchored protein
LNLLKSRFRRTTAIVAGAFLGLAGAVALVSPASAHNADLSGTASCVEAGGWKIEWTLVGHNSPVDGTIKSDGYSETPGGSVLTRLAANASVPTQVNIQETQTFPVTVKEVTLSFTVYWYDGKPFNWPVGKTVTQPEGCQPPSTPPTTPPPAADAPTPLLEQDCTTISIGVDNPKNGQEVTLKFETSKGEKRTTVIKPGERKLEKFSAVPGFFVNVTPTGIPGAGTEKIDYQQPANCAASGSGGGLPVTGAAAGSIAGGAGLLLVIGAVLFMVSRRRKVKFTA